MRWVLYVKIRQTRLLFESSQRYIYLCFWIFHVQHYHNHDGMAWLRQTLNLLLCFISPWHLINTKRHALFLSLSLLLALSVLHYKYLRCFLLPIHQLNHSFFLKVFFLEVFEGMQEGEGSSLEKQGTCKPLWLMLADTLLHALSFSNMGSSSINACLCLSSSTFMRVFQ